MTAKVTIWLKGVWSRWNKKTHPISPHALLAKRHKGVTRLVKASSASTKNAAPEAIVIPKAVIIIVNTLIFSCWDGDKAVIGYKDIVLELVKLGHAPEDFFAKGWWRFSDLYIKCGWRVYYDYKPEYNGGVGATYTFHPAV